MSPIETPDNGEELPLYKQYRLVMGGQGDEAMRERIFALLDDPDSELCTTRVLLAKPNDRTLQITLDQWGEVRGELSGTDNQLG